MDSLKQINNIFKGDKVIWVVFFLLCIVSIVEVYSASSSLGYKSGNYWKAATYHSFLLLIGVGVMVMTLNIKCKFFKLATPILVPLAFVMLILVFVCGTKENDAARWLKIGFIPIQPSEIAKGTMVLVTAQILSAMQRETGADRKAFKYILMILLPTTFLIGIENLSTAALLFAVIVLMMFIGRVPMMQMGKLVGVLAVAVVAFVALVIILGGVEESRATAENHMTETVAQPGGDPAADKDAIKAGGVFHRFATWRNRILKHFNNEDVPAENYDLEENFQVGHANIAIASSGIIGKGPGNSVERDYLPQAFSDFIYAIIIEEMGILGAAFVAFLYIVLLYRAARIASRCENNFPAFLIMGLSLLLVVQATFNMMVAVGLAPVTGQPLPLISKGGTSTIINCAYIGAILSVSRSAKMNKAVKEIND